MFKSFQSSPRRRPGSIGTAAQWIPAFAGITVCAFLTFAAPAHAESFTYAPEECEFQMIFPSEPYTSRRCHPDYPDKCDAITSFTKVFGVSNTMNFYVSCKKTETDMYESYSREILRTALIGMAGRGKLETFETSFDEDAQAKRGSILGAGPSYNGQNTMLYMGQIWAGHKSVLTLEAELIGDQGDETDKEFADILRSLTLKQEAKTEDAPEEPEDEKEPEKEQEKEEETKEKPAEKTP